MPRLHVHGGGDEALAAGDVGGRRLVIGRIHVVAVVVVAVSGGGGEFVDVVVLGRVGQRRGGAAVQGAARLLVQVLQGEQSLRRYVFCVDILEQILCV